jgi:hypothetical protein
METWHRCQAVMRCSSAVLYSVRQRQSTSSSAASWAGVDLSFSLRVLRTVSATLALLSILDVTQLFSNKAVEYLHHTLASECGDEAQGAQGARPDADGLIAWWCTHVVIVQH